MKQSLLPKSPESGDNDGGDEVLLWANTGQQHLLFFLYAKSPHPWLCFSPKELARRQ